MYRGSILEVERNFKKYYRVIREIVETIALTALIFLVINLAVQNYRIDGISMEPTLHDQERIMVDKVSYLLHGPSRGDVIVFIAPPDPSAYYIKRVIAIPGDVISVDGTTVKVDGVTLREPYVSPKFQGSPYGPIDNRVVPPNDYFVMGDDRINSSDSRAWGFVPRANIMGRATLVYWPLGEDNTGLLHNYSFVFANIHKLSLSLVSSRHSQLSPATNTMFLCIPPALLLFSARYCKRRSRRKFSY